MVRKTLSSIHGLNYISIGRQLPKLPFSQMQSELCFSGSICWPPLLRLISWLRQVKVGYCHFRDENMPLGEKGGPNTLEGAQSRTELCPRSGCVPVLLPGSPLPGLWFPYFVHPTLGQPRPCRAPSLGVFAGAWTVRERLPLTPGRARPRPPQTPASDAVRLGDSQGCGTTKGRKECPPPPPPPPLPCSPPSSSLPKDSTATLSC